VFNVNETMTIKGRWGKRQYYVEACLKFSSFEGVKGPLKRWYQGNVEKNKREKNLRKK